MVSAAVPCYLLDANVLLALFWPQHRHHAIAHNWFAEHVSGDWATCAITQSAFLRISLNRQVLQLNARYPEIMRQLERGTNRKGHVFWQEAPSLPTLPLMQNVAVQGYRQITDLYLLALTQHHKGRFVTFDAGVPGLLATTAERKHWVTLITA